MSSRSWDISLKPLATVREKSQRITTVMRIHPQGTMNVCLTKCLVAVQFLLRFFSPVQMSGPSDWQSLQSVRYSKCCSKLTQPHIFQTRRRMAGQVRKSSGHLHHNSHLASYQQPILVCLDPDHNLSPASPTQCLIRPRPTQTSTTELEDQTTLIWEVMKVTLVGNNHQQLLTDRLQQDILTYGC